jgi:uracil-DNA glycosylase
MNSTKKDQLLKLRAKMAADKTLPLRKTATCMVFGEGNPETKVFFLGEGPGYWEDQKGRPFVGNAGILLDKLLHSIELERKEVFISNVVCFRPPENRDPEDAEIAAFKPYIDEMISVIDPKIIVTLGRFSMGKFIPGVKISSVHGKVHRIQLNGKEIVVLPMYHPAAALRRNDVMLQIKEDFLKIPELLNEIKENKEKTTQTEQLEII